MTDETTQALLPCPPCPICRADATWETALTANVGGKEVIYGSCSECSCTAEYHDWLAHSLPSQADATSGEEMRLRTINHEIRDDLIAAAPETVSFEDLIAWLSTVRHFTWTWTANPRCKYVDIRIDTRRGAFAILDRDGNKITLDELRHQYRAALTEGAE